VEERPFQRVTRALLGKDSLLKWTPPRQLPSPPPDGEVGDEATEPIQNAEEARQRLEKFRSEILLDFAALESSILRIQLLQSSNLRERERYATEKASIVATAQSVRENTLTLRSQLAEAQKVLELRKGYDELATKLMKGLKSRDVVQEEITGLEKEIEDLEVEGREFEGVWSGRREAWEKVVVEGQNLIKVVKGIKDEPDERMEDGEEEGAVSGGKDDRSRMGTPALGGESTPMPGGATPLRRPEEEGMVMGGDATPLPADLGTPKGQSPAPLVNKFLDVEGDITRSSSQAASPIPQTIETEVDVDDQQALPEADVDMDGETKAASEDEMAHSQQQSEPPGPELEVMDES
jgi:hypothetical protein